MNKRGTIFSKRMCNVWLGDPQVAHVERGVPANAARLNAAKSLKTERLLLAFVFRAETWVCVHL